MKPTVNNLTPLLLSLASHALAKTPGWTSVGPGTEVPNHASNSSRSYTIKAPDLGSPGGSDGAVAADTDTAVEVSVWADGRYQGFNYTGERAPQPGDRVALTTFRLSQDGLAAADVDAGWQVCVSMFEPGPRLLASGDALADEGDCARALPEACRERLTGTSAAGFRDGRCDLVNTGSECDGWLGNGAGGGDSALYYLNGGALAGAESGFWAVGSESFTPGTDAAKEGYARSLNSTYAFVVSWGRGDNSSDVTGQQVSSLNCWRPAPDDRKTDGQDGQEDASDDDDEDDDESAAGIISSRAAAVLALAVGTIVFAL